MAYRGGEDGGGRTPTSLPGSGGRSNALAQDISASGVGYGT